jgi:hypothetical protein
MANEKVTAAGLIIKSNRKDKPHGLGHITPKMKQNDI